MRKLQISTFVISFSIYKEKTYILKEINIKKEKKKK